MSKVEREPLSALLTRRARAGKLVWIGLRRERHAPMEVVEEAELLEERGLRFDYASKKSGGKRQVSLIQAEHLPTVATLTGLTEVQPGLLRRNLVIAGINVLALRAAEFSIGACVLKGTGTCDPCSKLETALGEGGYNAMRGHGGVLARVVKGGIIRIGDPVDFVIEPSA